MFKITLVSYKLPNPPTKLKHRRRNLLECFWSLFMNSHICQICHRKEESVDGWFQIDDPIHKDKNGCSVVCLECKELNPEIFK
jgi:hypothetical protein